MLGFLWRPGVNLRGDLAKLDDAALAARLDEVLLMIEHLVAARHGAPFHTLAPHGWAIRRAWRGPLRGRIFYRLIWRLPEILGILLTRNIHTFDSDDERALYLAHCEAKDLMDEIKRRLPARQRPEARVRS
ncbi:hypothetical protein [Salinarimonas soli]|uniref:Uncharacterized protein n=1 Tax=Salinarimonas soli TaxID=1638099 RepID=A0A5B2VFF3_9HYPH|nr:hypothetical protein [Salinarimonas soli]KAA2237358.1 hypothetical protein F0L46_10185 [Salinarimonas soli]